MSNSTRWVLGTLFILLGIAFTSFMVFLGYFMPISCDHATPDNSLTNLGIAAIVSILSTVIPAVLFIRKASPLTIIIFFVLGAILTDYAYHRYFSIIYVGC